MKVKLRYFCSVSESMWPGPECRNMLCRVEINKKIVIIWGISCLTGGQREIEENIMNNYIMIIIYTNVTMTILQSSTFNDQHRHFTWEVFSPLGRTLSLGAHDDQNYDYCHHITWWSLWWILWCGAVFWPWSLVGSENAILGGVWTMSLVGSMGGFKHNAWNREKIVTWEWDQGKCGRWDRRAPSREDRNPPNSGSQARAASRSK